MLVSDLKNIHTLENLKLVAGESGLGNPIKSVNIMDNPLALDWLSAGELLLTSGYFFRESQQQQNEFLIGLHQIGCPCLCIKPKQFLSKIPENMIQIANEIGLPIFEIPYGLSFSKILVAVMNELGEKYDPISKKSIEIHNEFFRLSLNGSGLSSIGKKLSELTGNPVAFLDEHWKLLYCHDIPDPVIPMEECFSLQTDQRFFPDSFLKTLPYEIDKMQKPITREWKLHESSIHCRIMPAVAANQNYGYIVLLETARKLSEIDFVAMENASLVFAMERIHTAQLDAVKANLRGDFFDDLLTGKMHSLEDVKEQCSLFGINPLHNYVCLVVEVDLAAAKPLDNMAQRQYLLHQHVEQMLSRIRKLAYMVKRNLFCFHRRSTIIVMESRSTKYPTFSPEETLSLAEAIHEELHQNLEGVRYKIGIGRPCSTVLNWKRSFGQACEALRLSERLQPGNIITQYSDFEIYSLLEDNVPKELLQQFFDHVLGELYAYDKENNTALIETLESYLFNKYNATEAAKAMYIHRNTFFYRIEKIKTLLHSDLSTSEELFRYTFALKVAKLLGLHT